MSVSTTSTNRYLAQFFGRYLAAHREGRITRLEVLRRTSSRVC